jgi:hypothetical protein
MAKLPIVIPPKPLTLEERWPRREKYGWMIPAGISDFAVELKAMRNKLEGGNRYKSSGPEEHFWRITDMIWPKLEKHEWMQRRVKAFCENQVCVHTGSATSGKTFDAGLLSLVYYQCDPLNTSVVLTSTTSKMVRKRVWPVIRRLFFDAGGWITGNLVDSKTALQAEDGDDKHGVFAIAVKEGNVSKAAADIQGMHPKRMMIVIDEATDTPEAIFEVIPNLRSACDDFRLIVIGNANSHLDPHGMCAEPKAGWGSISVEDEEWITAGVPNWDIDSGICLHFDGTKSPNIKAGHRKYEFLINQGDIDRAKKTPEGEKTIWFWKYRRGFWPPDGLSKTVMSEALIAQFDGCGKLEFRLESFMVAALDPGFGGDKCRLQFGKIGRLVSGAWGIQVMDGVDIPLLATTKEHVHYQIAKVVKRECENRGVKPNHFAMDASGEGGGLAAILVREWSSKILWVEFGGAASDKPISKEDQRPAKAAYDRKVTELWFSARAFLISGQLKGLSRDMCVQFSSREFTDKGNRSILDTKEVCKAKIQRSPDDADAVAILCELARTLGYEPESIGKSQETDSNRWDEAANNVFANVDYSEPEQIES